MTCKYEKIQLLDQRCIYQELLKYKRGWMYDKSSDKVHSYLSTKYFMAPFNKKEESKMDCKNFDDKTLIWKGTDEVE